MCAALYPQVFSERKKNPFTHSVIVYECAKNTECRMHLACIVCELKNKVNIFNCVQGGFARFSFHFHCDAVCGLLNECKLSQGNSSMWNEKPQKRPTANRMRFILFNKQTLTQTDHVHFKWMCHFLHDNNENSGDMNWLLSSFHYKHTFKCPNQKIIHINTHTAIA